jgi:hypothetical protein
MLFRGFNLAAAIWISKRVNIEVDLPTYQRFRLLVAQCCRALEHARACARSGNHNRSVLARLGRPVDVSRRGVSA